MVHPPSLTPFDGKVITIAGASRGVGLALAKYLLIRGAKVSISSSSSENIANAVADIGRELPGHSSKDHLMHATCDITKLEDVESWIAETVKHFGRIDGCANVSGKTQRRLFPITHLALEDWHELVDGNMTGMFHLLREQMKVIRDGGSIVNVGSVSSHCSSAGFSAYCASKAGLEALTRCAAFEGAPRGIRVNSVSPGILRTEMTSKPYELFGGGEFYSTNETAPQLFKRYGEPEEVAAAIAYLLGDESTFVTRAMWSVDGGFMEGTYTG